MDTKQFDNISTDVSDTKVWNLILYVSTSGFNATYHNKISGECVNFLSTDWECSESELLHRLQDIVYQHSNMVGDHATTAIIESPHYMIIPSELTDSEEDTERLFEQLHPIGNEDFWVDTEGVYSIAFTSIRGLESFLQRTFIIKQIKSHLMPIVQHALSYTHGEQVIANLRRNRLDIVAINEGTLQLASTYDWQDTADVSYHILNAWNILGFNQQTAELRLYGNKSLRSQISEALKNFITFIIPPDDMSNVSSPLAVSLTAKNDSNS